MIASKSMIDDCAAQVPTNSPAPEDDKVNGVKLAHKVLKVMGGGVVGTKEFGWDTLIWSRSATVESSLGLRDLEGINAALSASTHSLTSTNVKITLYPKDLLVEDPAGSADAIAQRMKSAADVLEKLRARVLSILLENGVPIFKSDVQVEFLLGVPGLEGKGCMHVLHLFVCKTFCTPRRTVSS
jgi:hypothetical protein